MAELHKVGGPPSRMDRNLGRIIVIVIAGVLVAIVKPWGGAIEPLAVVTPTATPSPSPQPTAAFRRYDLLDFGVREPPPMWEVWSAGTLSSYSFALRIALAPDGLATPSPAAGPASSPSETATPSASDGAPAPGTDDVIPPTWPVVRIPTGSHLELIAINRPLGHTIDVAKLVQVAADGSETAFQAVTATSPWPSHVTVVGLSADDGTDAMRPWPPGRYRLDLRIGPDSTVRSLEIVVDALPTEVAPGAAPRSDVSPAATTGSTATPGAATPVPAATASTGG
jgi:hypothetical protein